MAYVDWSHQEFGIAAALSGDVAMMDAYASGDPYLTFAKQAPGRPQAMRPSTATRRNGSNSKFIRRQCSTGMSGAQSLARSLDQPEAMARELLKLHRQTYPKFWAWSEAAVNHAMLRGWLHTVFGSRMQVGSRANPRSLTTSRCKLMARKCCDWRAV